jgi:Stress responsive A/B Barrel Domain
MRVIARSLAAVCLLALVAPAARAEIALAHDVYFSLNDASPKAKDELVAACKKYLTGHDGIVYFSVGTLAAELNRPVNDRDFDVALHVYFKDRAAHDRYQEAPRHKQFIAEQQSNWKKVRVFDSTVDLLR